MRKEVVVCVQDVIDNGEAEVPIPVLIWVEEIYGFFFAHVCMFWILV